MATDEMTGSALRALSAALSRTNLEQISQDKQAVLARYRGSFQSARISELDRQTLSAFLNLKSNLHWSGLNRQAGKLCSDMKETRSALSDLVDEARPISDRMQSALKLDGLGKGIATAVLQVAYPDKYGVWNNVSDAGLEKLGVLPPKIRGEKIGARYARVNQVLLKLSRALGIDLWTLDTLWTLLNKREGLGLWRFIPGQQYDRQADIHLVFGGQERSGIVTPKNVPGIFIFTGQGGGAVGYQDHADLDGKLHYTGQGQVGDMEMKSGNKAIRDHAENGEDLLVFEQTKKGGLVTYLGLYVCSGWKTERQLDKNGNDREAIVFTLESLDQVASDEVDVATQPAPTTDLETLRKKAMEAAAPPKSKKGQRAATVYERSRHVRDYVLARAKGVCEGCDNNAPFQTNTDRPFLEAHHIRRLSDGGPDDPLFMAGICPNCHRRAHYAKDRIAFNEALQVKVDDIEIKKKSRGHRKK